MLKEGTTALVTFALFGQQMTVRAKLVHYDRPFVELQIHGVTRIFNENTIREIIPIVVPTCQRCSTLEQ
jgi:hypothetical protein